MSVLMSWSEASKKNKKIEVPYQAKELEKFLKLILKSLKNGKEFQKFTDLLGVPKSLELYFCEDKEMRSFNKKFRKIDRTTDVLSFPTIESPESQPKGFLGSLIISLAQVQRNASRYKRSFKEEFLEVYIHGVLHLFGYDHLRVSAQKKARMQKTQRELFVLLSDA
jgi:probable rRNA maturation factor